MEIKNKKKMKLIRIICIVTMLLINSLIVRAQNLLYIETARQIQYEYKLDTTKHGEMKIGTQIEKLDFSQIYNLRSDTSYTYNNKEDTILDIIYHPMGNQCQKSYNIPDDVFLNSYPFNAETITIYIPDSCCWMNPGDLLDYQDSKFRKLGQMSKDEVSEFANHLYNYDKVNEELFALPYSEITRNDYPPIFTYTFQKKSLHFSFEGESDYVIISLSKQVERIEAHQPNILIHFNFQDSIEYLALFFDGTENIRMMTTFYKKEEPYLGTECSCLNKRLRSFFQEKYNYVIKECISCDEEVYIGNLKEKINF